MPTLSSCHTTLLNHISTELSYSNLFSSANGYLNMMNKLPCVKIMFMLESDPSQLSHILSHWIQHYGPITAPHLYVILF